MTFRELLNRVEDSSGMSIERCYMFRGRQLFGTTSGEILAILNDGSVDRFATLNDVTRSIDNEPENFPALEKVRPK